MVVNSQTQGILSQIGSATNGGSQNGSKKADPITVEPPSHVTEYYPPNTLGCTEGTNNPLVHKSRFGITITIHYCSSNTHDIQMSGKQG